MTIVLEQGTIESQPANSSQAITVYEAIPGDGLSARERNQSSFEHTTIRDVLDYMSQQMLLKESGENAGQIINPIYGEVEAAPASAIRADNDHLFGVEQITAVQEALKSLGFYQGAIDGDYDVATATAAENFQKSVGLADDETVGIQTVRALRDAVDPSLIGEIGY